MVYIVYTSVLSKLLLVINIYNNTEALTTFQDQSIRIVKV